MKETLIFALIICAVSIGGSALVGYQATRVSQVNYAKIQAVNNMQAICDKFKPGTQWVLAVDTENASTTPRGIFDCAVPQQQGMTMPTK